MEEHFRIRGVAVIQTGSAAIARTVGQWLGANELNATPAARGATRRYPGRRSKPWLGCDRVDGVVFKAHDCLRFASFKLQEGVSLTAWALSGRLLKAGLLAGGQRLRRKTIKQNTAENLGDVFR